MGIRRLFCTSAFFLKSEACGLKPLQIMAELNVPLNKLATTEEMDFSHRGSPLTPVLPEHYANKAYVDAAAGRVPAVVDVECDGIETSYPVTHNLNTKDIASVQVYDTTDGTLLPIGVDWEPTSENVITLKPDVLLPETMTLRVVVSA